MYARFSEYVRKEGLFAEGRKFLLAVSGGADSVVLLHLMRLYTSEHRDIELAAAHCNFHLRGKESQRDEAFVRRLCDEAEIPLFVADFKTEEHARKQKISIEMAARELRYEFFRQLIITHAFDACLLAHHANDNAETFFINIFRGSGVKGLKGMLPKSGAKPCYLRPLLFALRSEILEYAQEHHLEFVEDSSNAEEVYVRNRVRHTLLPAAEKCCEDFVPKLNQSMQSLRLVDDLLNDWYVEVFAKVVEKQGADEVIYRKKLNECAHQALFLELYLLQKSFSRKQIEQISENRLHGTSGKKFHNTDGTGFLWREPEGWRWQPLGAALQEEVEPCCEQKKVILQHKSEMDTNPNVAYLDFEKLRFPLSWRHWQPGDKFCPLGMKGVKKLSDFFKDLHLSQTQKEKTWLLCCGKDIVWVAGYRIDNRYGIDFSKPGEKTAWRVKVITPSSPDLSTIKIWSERKIFGGADVNNLGGVKF